MTCRSHLRPSLRCARRPALREESVTRFSLHQTSKRTGAGVLLVELECANEGTSQLAAMRCNGQRILLADSDARGRLLSSGLPRTAGLRSADRFSEDPQPTHCCPWPISRRATRLPRNLTFAHAAEIVSDSGRSRVAPADQDMISAEYRTPGPVRGCSAMHVAQRSRIPSMQRVRRLGGDAFDGPRSVSAPLSWHCHRFCIHPLTQRPAALVDPLTAGVEVFDSLTQHTARLARNLLKWKEFSFWHVICLAQRDDGYPDRRANEAKESFQ